MLDDALKGDIQRAYSSLLESKGLRARVGQRLMIAEIARCLTSVAVDADGVRQDEAPVCVIEAGTGTGKTIAYIVATIPIAKALDKTVVIASATVALQEQIVFKDLPDIQHHSGLGFSYALAKGRGRYLCVAKLDQLLQDGGPDQAALALYPDEWQSALDGSALALYEAMLQALASGQWDGDRDNWAQELEPALWGRVTTDHAQCSARRCPHIAQCCFYKARERLGKVDVIVTNHDLVLADLALGGGAILSDPEHSIYIFDEGHHLPDKAISHFAQFARLHATERWLEQLARSVPRLHSDCGEAGGLGAYLPAVPDIIEQLKQALSALYSHLEQDYDALMEGERNSQYRFAQGLLPAALCQQAQALQAQFVALLARLEPCCRILEQAIEQQHPIARQVAEQWFPLLSMACARLHNNLALWEDYAQADQPQEPPRGRWLALTQNSAGQFDFELHSSPILAAATLEEQLWSRCFAAVVTSATLTALGSFERFKMHAAPPPSARYAVVPSPFDYASRGELYIPRMDCEPSDAEAHTLALIALLPTLLDWREGSLVLFSSRRQMEQVYQGLAEDYRQRIIMQGLLPKQEMLKSHRQRIDQGEGSVLFGLASFAEGVDLPGDYCRHVVIAKIPFAVPDQPIEAALSEWVQARGGNAFMEVAVPDACVRLVQACGRLLRTESDSGRVSLLDRRVVSKRYGRAMLDCLPPLARRIE